MNESVTVPVYTVHEPTCLPTCTVPTYYTYSARYNSSDADDAWEASIVTIIIIGILLVRELGCASRVYLCTCTPYVHMRWMRGEVAAAAGDGSRSSCWIAPQGRTRCGFSMQFGSDRKSCNARGVVLANLQICSCGAQYVRTWSVLLASVGAD